MRWPLKSPASPLFTQPFIQAQIKENIKAPRHRPLCGEFTGNQWILRTNGQQRGKCFHLMTSSCSTMISSWIKYTPFIMHTFRALSRFIVIWYPAPLPLTQWGRYKVAAISQRTFSNAFSWMKMFKFLLKFHWNWFCWVSNWHYSRIGSDNGLSPTRQQASIRTNNNLIHWRIYASLGLNELTFRDSHWCMSIKSVLFSSCIVFEINVGIMNILL